MNERTERGTPRPHVTRRGLMVAALALLAAVVLSSCRLPQGIELSPSATNVVITKENRIFIDDYRTTYKRLIYDLRARGLSDTTYIVVHFHAKASVQLFDYIVQTMKTEGYQSVTYKYYGD